MSVKKSSLSPFLLLVFLLINAGGFSYSQQIDNYLDSASLFKESKDYDKAIEVLTSISGQDKSPQVDKFLAKLHYLNGESGAAVKILKNCSLKDWLVYLYLGLCYEDTGNNLKAIESYTQSVRLKKNSIALYRLGKVYYNRGQYSDAQDAFAGVIALDSSIRLAYYYLGNCFIKQKSWQDAYDYLSKAVNFYPENKMFARALADVKKELGQDFFIAKKEKSIRQREKVQLVLYERQEGGRNIDVGIGVKLKEFTFKGKDFYVSDGVNRFEGENDKFYTIILKDNKLYLRNYEKNIIYEEFSSPAFISAGNYPFYIFDIVFGGGDFWHKELDRAYRGNLKVIIKDNFLTLVNVIDLEEYLYGVLPAEILPRAGVSALLAQAVAARTFAVKNLGQHKNEGFDLCCDVHCQVYHGISVETPSANKAVDYTKGKILVYDGKPIEAFYHANCGGCLCGDSFNSRQYLKEQFDAPPAGALDFFPKDSLSIEAQWFSSSPQAFCYASSRSDFRWQRVYDRQDFSLVFGFVLEDLQDINCLTQGDCFHCKEIEISSLQGITVVKGDLKIRNYFDKLRSNAFNLDLKLSADGKPQMLFFWGAGFGHGAGMCQQGAMAMAEQGYSYQDILGHYYPNTEIKDFFQ